MGKSERMQTECVQKSIGCPVTEQIRPSDSVHHAVQNPGTQTAEMFGRWC